MTPDRERVQTAVEQMLDALGFDWRNDPNMMETPRRITKMYIDEVFGGCFQEKPRLADFPNTEKNDQLFAVGPIPVRSMCSHHFAPILGEAWIGVIPGERLLGLSKYSRLTEWVMARPTLQEDACVRLADEIEKVIKPRALGVVIRASHTCVTVRGVKNEKSLMTSSVMRGALRDDPETRAEFMSMIRGMGY